MDDGMNEKQDLEFLNLVKKLIPPKRDKKYAYKMGLNFAKNGANTTNCHFSIFSSPENSEAWVKGAKDGKK